MFHVPVHKNVTNPPAQVPIPPAAPPVFTARSVGGTAVAEVEYLPVVVVLMGRRYDFALHCNPDAASGWSVSDPVSGRHIVNTPPRRDPVSTAADAVRELFARNEEEFFQYLADARSMADRLSRVAA